MAINKKNSHLLLLLSRSAFLTCHSCLLIVTLFFVTQTSYLSLLTLIFQPYHAFQLFNLDVSLAPTDFFISLLSEVWMDTIVNELLSLSFYVSQQHSLERKKNGKRGKQCQSDRKKIQEERNKRWKGSRENIEIRIDRD